MTRVQNVSTTALILCLVELLGTHAIHGQCHTQKLLPSDGLEDDEFGTSTAVQFDVAVVGVPRKDLAEGQDGVAYVFRFVMGSWVEEQILAAGDSPPNGESFGRSVALDNDVLFIGANSSQDVCPPPSCANGSCYVFRFNGTQWIEEQKLLASDAAVGQLFGISVALSGNVAIIGADHSSPGPNMPGAAYVFRFDGKGWVEEQKLVASDGEDGDRFGGAVAIDGDVAVVGAYLDGAGSAYVFRYDGQTWVEEQKLTGDNLEGNDHFGFAVSMSGDVVVVGARFDAEAGSSSGAVYVFRFDGSTWNNETKLLPDDAEPGSTFGWSVSLLDDTLAVGSPHDNIGDESNLGSVYLFEYAGATWTQASKLLSPDANEGDLFGYSVSLDAEHLLVGEQLDDELDDNVGAAHVFHVAEGPDCNQNGMADTCDILLGLATDADENGVPDECQIQWTRGDANGDSSIDIADGISILNTLFQSGPPFSCESAADVTGDDMLNSADAIAIFAYQLLDGPAPPAPFPDCGEVDSLLGCAEGPASCQ